MHGLGRHTATRHAARAGPSAGAQARAKSRAARSGGGHPARSPARWPRPHSRQQGLCQRGGSDICQAAGVTRPVFYALFEGKEDAFLAAYRQGTRVLFHMVEDAYLDASDWRSGIRFGLAVLLEVLASVPSFAAMAIVEIDAVGSGARQERDQLLRRFERVFPAPPGPPPLLHPPPLPPAAV